MRHGLSLCPRGDDTVQTTVDLGLHSDEISKNCGGHDKGYDSM